MTIVVLRPARAARALALTARALGLAAMLGGALPAMAQPAQAPVSAQPVQQPSPSFHPNDVPVGETTWTLLEIQRNGSQAGPQQSMTGEQAALGYARYMRSFQHPLPEFFSSQATGSAMRNGSGGPPPVGQ
jgi:hypothetical protein